MKETEELHPSPLIAKLLKNRGIHTKQDAEVFLKPNYERDINDPFLMKNMERAVVRILSAMKQDEKIVIYGDYDCDGIPGSVVLHDLFARLGYEHFSNYIPHRENEGYGLNTPAVEQFAKNGTALLITVDCGIADVEQVARAQELGMDVIVTDHHLPQEVLPPAYAVLNPKQEGDEYPDDMLCGAGVAWKLAQAILTRAREQGVCDVPPGWEKWLLDMAGLSTIADMVPLQKENRAIAHFGLTVLRRSKRPGLLALLKELRIAQEYLAEDDIGFMIAPRINAASRMDVPFRAFELLSTRDPKQAKELAQHLQKINERRKGIVATIIKDARKHLKERTVRELIVIGNPNWQPGVLGLVAGKLVEDYARPVFVWGKGEAVHIKGSCRSDGSVNVVALMQSVRAGMFLDLGGHEASGGFSITHDQVHLLEDELVIAYETLRRERSTRPGETAEAELTLDEITWKLAEEVAELAPFGMGNPRPVFLFRDVPVASIRKFGKEKNHLEMTFISTGGKKVTAIKFFGADESALEVIAEGTRVDLSATIEISRWAGKKELRLRIVDVVKI